MASALPDPAGQPDQPDPPRQYWLDVARPIQPRAPRDRVVRARSQRRPDDALAGRQMELHMTAPVRAPSPTPSVSLAIVAPPAAATAEPRADMMVRVTAPILPPPLSFVKWLLAQNKNGGAIGELAKAARLDPLFPRDGGADAVRARFSKAGADGDAFAALEDAERVYDRLE